MIVIATKIFLMKQCSAFCRNIKEIPYTRIYIKQLKNCLMQKSVELNLTKQKRKKCKPQGYFNIENKCTYYINILLFKIAVEYYFSRSQNLETIDEKIFHLFCKLQTYICGYTGDVKFSIISCRFVIKFKTLKMFVKIFCSR